MGAELITVAETPEFLRKAKNLLPEKDRHTLISHLAMYPLSGVVIEGTGGIRKLRWKVQGKGKSGGLRIIYFFFNEKIPLYVLTVYSKGKKDDLSAEERSELAKLVDILVKFWEL